ncbi:hypothetical protein [uncultured Thiodictyon sp.]|uniref:hypothetical protein n=1 Tax=uncultured Thiodictyon sp. TaxID=1846217 RepID=UPI0025F6A87E|nr:hypothetical protein [uncultured Thiodictyon sp.]
MNGIIARRPRTAPFVGAPRTRLAAFLALVVAALLAGCAGGLIGQLPPVNKPAVASNVTVYRDDWTGFVGPIILRIDGHRMFRLWVNQQFSFQLDPGNYLFYYTIGFNECRRVAFIEPRRSYQFRLGSNCARFEDGY